MEEHWTGWEKPSRREKVALAVVVFLLVGSACSNVVLRAVWPNLAIESAIRVADTPGIYAEEDLDPWGRPWRRFDYGWCSWGPNGVGELGEGDDQIVIDGPILAAFTTDEPLWHLSAWSLAPRNLLAFAFLLSWLGAVRRLWSAHRVALRWELVWAGVLSSLPVSVVWAFAQGRTWTSASFPTLLVPTTVALAGTISVVIFMAALWFRVRRSTEKAAPEAPGKNSSGSLEI